MGLDYSALVVKRVGDKFQLQQVICQKADKGKPETIKVLAELEPTDKDKINYEPAIYEEIYLRLIVKDGAKMSLHTARMARNFKLLVMSSKCAKASGLGLSLVSLPKNLQGKLHQVSWTLIGFA